MKRISDTYQGHAYVILITYAASRSPELRNRYIVEASCTVDGVVLTTQDPVFAACATSHSMATEQSVVECVTDYIRQRYGSLKPDAD
jgi:ABC-type Fe2+-enterobactin transport system substrate-binding protein